MLIGALVDAIATMEMELDCAMALCNLLLRGRLNLLASIPVRPRHAPRSHIITPNLEPSMKIPKAVKLSDVRFPAHIKDFCAALTSIAPTLRKITACVGRFTIFTDRVLKRGDNLFLAGNVLQITAEHVNLDVWRVLFLVGASMKRVLYRCYAELNQNEGVVASACECKNGYVIPVCAHMMRRICRARVCAYSQFFLFQGSGVCTSWGGVAGPDSVEQGPQRDHTGMVDRASSPSKV